MPIVNFIVNFIGFSLVFIGFSLVFHWFVICNVNQCRSMPIPMTGEAGGNTGSMCANLSPARRRPYRALFFVPRPSMNKRWNIALVFHCFAILINAKQ